MQTFKVEEPHEGYPVSCPLRIKSLEGLQFIFCWSDGQFSDTKEDVIYFPAEDVLVKISDSLWQGVGISYRVITLAQLFELGLKVFNNHKTNHPMRWLEGMKELLSARAQQA